MFDGCKAPLDQFGQPGDPHDPVAETFIVGRADMGNSHEVTSFGVEPTELRQVFGVEPVRRKLGFDGVYPASAPVDDEVDFAL